MKFIFFVVLFRGCFATSILQSVIGKINVGRGTTQKPHPHCVRTPKPPGINHRLALNYVDYAFSCEEHREQAIASGDFIQGNSFMLDIFPHYMPDGSFRLFVTTPNYVKSGSPASLSVVDFENPSYLVPYPDWSYYGDVDDCPPNRILSAARLQVCISETVFKSSFIQEYTFIDCR